MSTRVALFFPTATRYREGNYELNLDSDAEVLAPRSEGKRNLTRARIVLSSTMDHPRFHFLSAAQDCDIAGKHTLHCDDGPPEPQYMIDRSGRIAAASHDISQIDQPVARYVALREALVNPRQFFDLAMHGGHRPHPLWMVQNRNYIGIDKRVRHGSILWTGT